MGNRTSVYRSRSINQRPRQVFDHPPTTPAGLTSTAIRSTEADLSWTASVDDQAVSFYEVIVSQP